LNLRKKQEVAYSLELNDMNRTISLHSNKANNVLALTTTTATSNVLQTDSPLYSKPLAHSIYQKLLQYFDTQQCVKAETYPLLFTTTLCFALELADQQSSSDSNVQPTTVSTTCWHALHQFVLHQLDKEQRQATESKVKRYMNHNNSNDEEKQQQPLPQSNAFHSDNADGYNEEEFNKQTNREREKTLKSIWQFLNESLFQSGAALTWFHALSEALLQRECLLLKCDEFSFAAYLEHAALQHQESLLLLPQLNSVINQNQWRFSDWVSIAALCVELVRSSVHQMDFLLQCKRRNTYVYTVVEQQAICLEMLTFVFKLQLLLEPQLSPIDSRFVLSGLPAFVQVLLHPQSAQTLVPLASSSSLPSSTSSAAGIISQNQFKDAAKPKASLLCCTIQ
jgi:hypothetical protein